MAYGYDTHSWRNSTEKRQMDKERKAVTAKHESAPRQSIPLPTSWIMCWCVERRWPHAPHGEREMKTFRPWFRWDHLEFNQLGRGQNGTT